MSTTASSTPGRPATGPVNQLFADAVLEQTGGRSPARGHAPGLPLYLTGRSIRERRPESLTIALQPHPVAVGRLLAGAPQARAGRSVRACWRRHLRPSDRPYARNFLETLEAFVRDARGSTSPVATCGWGAEQSGCAPTRSRSTPISLTDFARGPEVAQPATGPLPPTRARRPAQADRARRPTRAVQERAARLPRLRGAAQAPARATPSASASWPSSDLAPRVCREYARYAAAVREVGGPGQPA